MMSNIVLDRVTGNDGQGDCGPARSEPTTADQAFYRVFSLIFHRPDRELVRYLRNGLLADIAFLGLAAVGGFARFLDEHRDQDDDALYYLLAVEYTRLFVNGTPRVPCPPYESIYREGTTMGTCTMAALAKYRLAGLNVCDDFHDLPDHIAVELEFLHYLLSKDDRLGHDSFVREHLSKWLPAFHQAIAQNSRIDFYRHAAAVLEQVTAELIAEAA